jgi:hypothetical protein
LHYESLLTNPGRCKRWNPGKNGCLDWKQTRLSSLLPGILASRGGHCQRCEHSEMRRSLPSSCQSLLTLARFLLQCGPNGLVATSTGTNVTSTNLAITTGPAAGLRGSRRDN